MCFCFGVCGLCGVYFFVLWVHLGGFVCVLFFVHYILFIENLLYNYMRGFYAWWECSGFHRKLDYSNF